MKLPTWMFAVFLCASAFARDTADVPEAEASLRNALFARSSSDGKVYGQDDLDVLFWDGTTYLLSDPSRATALAALDEFDSKKLARKIKDPVRRAILQRDLWRLFDWTMRDWQPAGAASKAREELRPRLAAAMKQLALDEKEISRLPHNLNAVGEVAGIADFPRGLLDDSGAWIMLGANGDDSAAPQHMQAFDGHSSFVVLLRLPRGRAVTLDYLQTLRSVLPVGNTDAVIQHPEVGFPPDTLWALVRVMNVIDVDGSIRPTQLIESIQLRRYKVVLPSSEPASLASAIRQTQETFELQLDRANLPDLRALAASERQFHNPQFMGHGMDAISPQGSALAAVEIDRQREPVLRMCVQCHGGPALLSVRSYVGMFNEHPTPANQPSRFEREVAFAAKWKEKQDDWQELRRLWGN